MYLSHHYRLLVQSKPIFLMKITIHVELANFSAAPTSNGRSPKADAVDESLTNSLLFILHKLKF